MDYVSRIADLRARLRSLPGAVVAFSGGVDSSMLLHASVAALGDRVIAVTADSPSLPRTELEAARALARRFGVEHRILSTGELDLDGYRRNNTDRCYFCKSELFAKISQRLAAEAAADWPVLYGAIVDDLGDHRPGAAAAVERGVLAPLADAGLGKVEVRRYSREHDLPTADKPSLACLASRVPYGTRIDGALLHKLEAAEEVLRRLEFRQFRVRHHGDVARIEVDPSEIERVARERSAIVAGVRAAGYTYVALDLVGYRTGAMNEVLK